MKIRSIKFIKKFIQCFYPPILVYLLPNYLIGVYFQMYLIWSRYDILVHFFGGVSMAITGYLLLKLCEKQKWIRIHNKYIYWLLIICYVCATAILWEFYEFLCDHYLGTFNQPSLADTIGDMFNGMVGGIVGGVLLIWKKQK